MKDILILALVLWLFIACLWAAGADLRESRIVSQCRGVGVFDHGEQHYACQLVEERHP